MSKVRYFPKEGTWSKSSDCAGHLKPHDKDKQYRVRKGDYNHPDTGTSYGCGEAQDGRYIYLSEDWPGWKHMDYDGAPIVKHPQTSETSADLIEFCSSYSLVKDTIRLVGRSLALSRSSKESFHRIYDQYYAKFEFGKAVEGTLAENTVIAIGSAILDDRSASLYKLSRSIARRVPSKKGLEEQDEGLRPWTDRLASVHPKPEARTYFDRPSSDDYDLELMSAWLWREAHFLVAGCALSHRHHVAQKIYTSGSLGLFVDGSSAEVYSLLVQGTS